MKKFLLALIFTFSATANAGFMIEPYAGFALGGAFDQQATPPTTGEYSGVQFGGRAGLTFMGLMGGVSYNMATETDIEFKQLTTTATNKATRSDLGLFVGYELPIMLRVWGTYYLDSKVEGSSNTGTTFIDSTETWKGSGYGLGVGFTFLPFVSLNLEYRNFEYDEEDDSDSTPVTSAINPVLSGNEIFVSVSLPLGF